MNAAQTHTATDIEPLHRYGLDFEDEWPEILTSLLNKLSKLLLIFDCFLENLPGYRRMDQIEDTWRFPKLIGSHIGFEVMGAGYKDRSILPGAFSSYIAKSLEFAAAEDFREGFMSTDLQRMKISELGDFEGQGLKPFHLRHCESVAWITLYPASSFSLKRSHEELERDDQARLLENKIPIYENGITEIFKTRIIRGPKAFGKDSNVVCLT